MIIHPAAFAYVENALRTRPSPLQNQNRDIFFSALRSIIAWGQKQSKCNCKVCNHNVIHFAGQICRVFNLQNVSNFIKKNL